MITMDSAKSIYIIDNAGIVERMPNVPADSVSLILNHSFNSGAYYVRH